MSAFDTDRPGYSADRIYEAADFMVKERKENPTRYDCPEGCGAAFLTVMARDAHFLVEHGDAAA